MFKRFQFEITILIAPHRTLSLLQLLIKIMLLFTRVVCIHFVFPVSQCSALLFYIIVFVSWTILECLFTGKWLLNVTVMVWCTSQDDHLYRLMVTFGHG